MSALSDFWAALDRQAKPHVARTLGNLGFDFVGQDGASCRARHRNCGAVHAIEYVEATNPAALIEACERHLERENADAAERAGWTSIGGGISIPSDHQIGVADCRCVACRPEGSR